jgi:SagB-type dehydrogenase family enzyme
MRSLCTLLTAGLICFCSCNRIPAQDQKAAEETTRTLDEMSKEQLRVFLKGYSGDWRGDTDQSKGITEPSFLKDVPEDAVTVDLAKPDTLLLGNAPLADVIVQRRSTRRFSKASLDNEELSFLLWCTQGISETVRDDAGEILHHLRTVPSGGARHPLETYLAIHRVDGIRPGVYRYLPDSHSLLLVAEASDLPALMTRLCYGQAYAGEASVVFIWAAIPYRTEWRYGYIAHRMIAMDAGHVCQNLYLAAESIGAGACAMLAYDQEGTDSLIGVDGSDEFAIYLAAVGKKRFE